MQPIQAVRAERLPAGLAEICSNIFPDRISKQDLLGQSENKQRRALSGLPDMEIFLPVSCFFDVAHTG